jgi:membrane protease YdiL (CAAX protease family)
MGDIATRIRALSARGELVIVVVLAFGWFAYSSLRDVLDITASGVTGPPGSEAELIRGLAYEAIVLVVLGWFLRLRGWTGDDLGLDPSWGDGANRLALGLALRAAQGIVLAFAVAFAYQIIVVAIWELLRQRVTLTDAAAFPRDLGVAALLGVLIINSIFEELFLCGYLISRLSKRRGLWFAVNVSTAIRLSYHLYQGSAGVPSIVPTGLIFGYWFARTRQLWPLIVAHAYLNYLAWLYQRLFEQ